MATQILVIQGLYGFEIFFSIANLIVQLIGSLVRRAIKMT